MTSQDIIQNDITIIEPEPTKMTKEELENYEKIIEERMKDFSIKTNDTDNSVKHTT